jgi:hypothetical protein
MIKLIDILNETSYVLSNNELEDLYDFQVTIEDGEIIEDDEDYMNTRKSSPFYNSENPEWDSVANGVFVQVEYFDPKEEEYTDIGNYPNPKKYVSSGNLEEYVDWLGAGLWTKDPLEKYKGDGDWDPLGRKYHTYQFDTFEEVENFMKNHLKDKIRDIYKLK